MGAANIIFACPYIKKELCIQPTLKLFFFILHKLDQHWK